MNSSTEPIQCARCDIGNTAAILCDACVAALRKGHVGKTNFKKTTTGNHHHGEWISYQRAPLTSSELLQVVIDIRVSLAMRRRRAQARPVPSHFTGEDTYSNAYDDDDMDEGAWT